MGKNMSRKSAFTLLELLTVIAIIGILSAILFPVYAQVRVSAYRSSDMSNMNAIRTALQLYKTDQGAYPPQLLGYATLYTSGPNTGQVIPANQIVGCLYPKRVESVAIHSSRRSPTIGILKPQYNLETTAVWPSGQLSDGVTPVSELSSGKRRASAAMRDAGLMARPDGFVSYDASGNIGVTGTPFQYYTVSGYDTALVKSTTGTRRELRYALFWSAYGLNSGSASDSAQISLAIASSPGVHGCHVEFSTIRDYDSTGAKHCPGWKARRSCCF